MNNELLDKYNSVVSKIIEMDKDSVADGLLQKSGYDLHYAIDLLKIIINKNIEQSEGSEKGLYIGVLKELS